jgi:hypothetical protein
MDDHVDITVKPATFDYGLNNIDPDTAEKLRSMEERVRSKVKKIEHDCIEVGRDLLSAKFILKKRGAFGLWVNSVGLSASTALNFMRAAKFVEAQQNRNVVDLLPAAAIYKLVAPSTPSAVREDIIARLEKGESMSTKAITQEIAARRQESAHTIRQEKLTAKHQQQSKQPKASREKGDEELLELEARQRDEEAAARQAVALLRDRLFGDQFREFVSLFEQSGSRFKPELRKELATKDVRA